MRKKFETFNGFLFAEKLGLNRGKLNGRKLKTRRRLNSSLEFLLHHKTLNFFFETLSNQTFIPQKQKLSSRKLFPRNYISFRSFCQQHFSFFCGDRKSAFPQHHETHSFAAICENLLSPSPSMNGIEKCIT
jgi:hypothetical protein